MKFESTLSVTASFFIDELREWVCKAFCDIQKELQLPSNRSSSGKALTSLTLFVKLHQIEANQHQKQFVFHIFVTSACKT